jgi:hypothetical protein
MGAEAGRGQVDRYWHTLLGDSTSVPRRQCSRAPRRRILAAPVCVPPLFVKHRFSVLGKGVPALKLIESVSKLGA